MIYSLGNKIPVVNEETYVADSAAVIGDVVLEKDVNIWFGAVLRGDLEKIIIGEGSNVQDNSTVHTDFGIPCIIGKNVTVGHNVILHSCNIEDNVIVGMGSTVLNGAKVAKNCLIGANSLVTHKTPYEEGSLIMGQPAKIIRKLNEDEMKHILENARHYVENGAHFKKELKEIK